MEKTPSIISLPVRFETPPEKDIPLSAFLFHRNGSFIQEAPVTKEQAEFKNPGADPRELRVFVAPAREQGAPPPTRPEDLEPLKPYEAILSREARGALTILPIPSAISRWWLRCSCRVTGQISKWFRINDSWQDRPICQARVHICDIDAIWYWIYRIPDHVILKVPELVLEPQRVPPIPIPDPGPLREIGLGQAGAGEPVAFQTRSLEVQKADAGQQLPVLSEDIQKQLRSGNVDLIRETVANHFQLFHPYFCLYPWWWPHFYHCDEIAVTYTDLNGRFDKLVRYPCHGDHPDIYIWVECMIDGVWTTVYRPSIPCHTHWNYACGTDIRIHITDERVHWGCNEILPGQAIWIKTVGQGASVSHIRQSHQWQAPPDQAVAYDRIGLTDAPAIYDPAYLPTSPGDYKRPFGGRLTFLLQFSSGLPAANIYHYRWRYRKVAHADLSPAVDTLHILNNPVFKSYTFEYLDSMNVTHFGSNSVKLGPFTVGTQEDLFIIPPTDPSMPPFSVPEASSFWDQNTYSVNFDSESLSDGLYEFRLELFDQGGNPVVNVAKTLFQVPDFSTFSPSVNAPDSLLLGPTATTADGYRMLMRIENGQCSANIYTIQVNGVSSSSNCCGFVDYKPGNAEGAIGLSFLAAQPNQFAVFSFGVQRGTCYDPVMSAATRAQGMVIDSAGGYLRNSASIYRKTFTPAQLLGSCYDGGTGKAAFAESLHVAAMATDGTYRLKGKDASQLAAFALEP